jgi:hypothetical protein
VDIIKKVSKVWRSRHQCPPLSPSYIQEAKGIILLRSTKAGGWADVSMSGHRQAG